MKHFALALFLLGAIYADAANLWTFAWWKNPEPEVVGYRLYRENGTNWVLVGETTQTNYGPVVPGCYAVTAFSSNGESARSSNLCAFSTPVTVDLTQLSTNVTASTGAVSVIVNVNVTIAK